MRATTLPSSVPGGKPYYVPANSECVYLLLCLSHSYSTRASVIRVAYFVWMMQKNKDIWGPDAEKAGLLDNAHYEASS